MANNNGQNSKSIETSSETKSLSSMRETLIKHSSSSTPTSSSTATSSTTTSSSSDSDDITVEIMDLHYTYGRGKKAVEVIKGISLTVLRGNICAILGPSGCGKTTLIHCLVGNLKPKEGFVRIYGAKPGSRGSHIPGPGVGYMPQEIGLFKELTIEETLKFFGRLFRIPMSTIKENTDFLLNFLQLPDRTRLIKNLSGGQQRRVSMATALIHKPPLLILDEPTVGVDPVLRHNIWIFLMTLSNEGITTIVTTHYVEEAMKANVAAFIRQGTLLKEGSPKSLLAEFKVDTLEKVFLTLCKQKKSPDESDNFTIDITNNNQNGVSNDPAKEEIDDYAPVKLGDDTPKDVILPLLRFSQIPELKKRNPVLDHFSRTYALLQKNYLRHRRNLPVFCFTLIIPSLVVALFFGCVGRSPFDIPITVHNGERGDHINCSKTKFHADYSNITLGRIFLSFIDDRVIKQTLFDNIDDAETTAKGSEKYWAMISIGENFTCAFIKRIQQFNRNGQIKNVTVHNRTQKNFMDILVNASRISVYPDFSEQFIASAVMKELQSAFQKFINHLTVIHEQKIPLKSIEMPLHIEKALFGTDDKEPPVSNWMAPGFLITLLFFSIIAPTALSLIMERKSGVLDRMFIAGMIPYEFIISQIITGSLITIIQTLFMAIITFLVFAIPCDGKMFWVILLMFLMGLCGLSYGLFLSAIFVEENTAFIVSMASMLPTFVMSGALWPVDTMPLVLAFIARILPLTRVIEAMRFIMYRSWDPSYSPVMYAYISCSLWTLFFLIGASIIFSIKKAH